MPIPDSCVFDDLASVEAVVRERDATYVVKADGLALGKGVVVPQTAVSNCFADGRATISGGVARVAPAAE